MVSHHHYQYYNPKEAPSKRGVGGVQVLTDAQNEKGGRGEWCDVESFGIILLEYW